MVFLFINFFLRKKCPEIFKKILILPYMDEYAIILYRTFSASQTQLLGVSDFIILCIDLRFIF